MSRFTITEGKRAPTGLLIGVTGPSGSGKTFSALRLATGIQRVSGGHITVVDTEARRATHYADRFKFRHIDFAPPFGPLDYIDAIQAAVDDGAKVVVVDSATHEHSGEGGVLDQAEVFLHDRAGDDYKKRERMLMASLVKPKGQRKRLNFYLEQLGRQLVSVILCYRAVDKIKPQTGGEPLKLGWQPETTSTLPYEMVQRFLLMPASGGVPSTNPVNEAEKLAVKAPIQFAGWVKSEPLSEELGERMAKWALVTDGSQAQAPKGPTFKGAKGGEWTGKPLASAPADVLGKYRAVVANSLSTASDQNRADELSDHLADVDAAMAALVAQASQ